jgi:hypothetical protein
MGWVVNTTPRPLYSRERPGTHCRGGWVAPAPVWTGAENLARPTGIRSLDRPARSKSLQHIKDECECSRNWFRNSEGSQLQVYPPRCRCPPEIFANGHGYTIPIYNVTELLNRCQSVGGGGGWGCINLCGGFCLKIMMFRWDKRATFNAAATVH